MTSKQPYPEEFKIKAVKQIAERGHRVAEVSARIGVSQHSLYKWIKAYSAPATERQAQLSQTERTAAPEGRSAARDGGARHLKKGRRVLCQAVRVRYAFIKVHEAQHSVRRMCQVMQMHPSGYYAWKAEPQSPRAKDDQRLTGLL